MLVECPCGITWLARLDPSRAGYLSSGEDLIRPGGTKEFVCLCGYHLYPLNYHVIYDVAQARKR